MDILRRFFENEKNKQSVLILFFIGVLLVIVNGVSEKDISNTNVLQAEEVIQYSSYTKTLEKKLENILSQVAGAGDVLVMITLNNEGEKKLAFDFDYSKKVTNETDNNGGIRGVEETKENTTTLFSNSNPVILEESTPSVKGVVIITDGGDNEELVQAFKNVCMSLLELPAHKIQILKKK